MYDFKHWVYLKREKKCITNALDNMLIMCTNSMAFKSDVRQICVNLLCTKNSNLPLQLKKYYKPKVMFLIIITFL